MPMIRNAAKTTAMIGSSIASARSRPAIAVATSTLIAELPSPSRAGAPKDLLGMPGTRDLDRDGAVLDLPCLTVAHTAQRKGRYLEAVAAEPAFLHVSLLRFPRYAEP